METVKNTRVERQIFSLLPPIINAPRSPIDCPVSFPHMQLIVHKGILTDKHYMCLDIISDLFTRLFIKKYFSEKLPRRYDINYIKSFSKFRHQKEIEKIFLGGNLNVVKIPILKDVIYAYPWMRKFHFKIISQLFEELSKLTISANLEVVYFQRIMKSDFQIGSLRIEEKISNYYKKWPFRFEEKSIFNFEYLSKQAFAFILQNAMGNLLMNNCAMLHHICVPDEFYTLSKYAQFLYRKLIAKRFNKDHEYPLEMVAPMVEFTEQHHHTAK